MLENFSLFTSTVLEGLQGQADANQDQQIQVSELRAYMTKKVQELTNNRQTPTIRREILDFVFKCINNTMQNARVTWSCPDF